MLIRCVIKERERARVSALSKKIKQKEDCWAPIFCSISMRSHCHTVQRLQFENEFSGTLRWCSPTLLPSEKEIYESYKCLKLNWNFLWGARESETVRPHFPPTSFFGGIKIVDIAVNLTLTIWAIKENDEVRARENEASQVSPNPKLPPLKHFVGDEKVFLLWFMDGVCVCVCKL